MDCGLAREGWMTGKTLFTRCQALTHWLRYTLNKIAWHFLLLSRYSSQVVSAKADCIVCSV